MHFICICLLYSKLYPLYLLQQKQGRDTMKNTYMSEWEIQALAEAALTSYEGTASWSRAFEAAVEFSADEWEITRK